MGYVLPITNYQYHDYKKRVMEKKTDPYYIEKPFKSVLESRHEDVAKGKTQQESLKAPFAKHKQMKTEALEISYMMMTGKGSMINEQV